MSAFDQNVYDNILKYGNQGSADNYKNSFNTVPVGIGQPPTQTITRTPTIGAPPAADMTTDTPTTPKVITTQSPPAIPAPAGNVGDNPINAPTNAPITTPVNTGTNTEINTTVLPTDSLKYIAQQHGLIISAPDKNNVVTVTNPTTGQSIQFVNNGAHPEYGMTGIVDNYNRIGDSSAFLNALGIYPDQYHDQLASTLQSLQSFPDYKSPYADQMKQLWDSIYNSKFSYDPNSDQAFQTDKNAVTQNALELANERGIVNSTVAADNVNQAVSNLVGQYRDKALQQYNDDLSKKMNMLQQLDKWDSEEYQKRNDKYAQLKDQATYIMQLSDDDYAKFQNTIKQRADEQTAQYNAYDTQLKQQQQDIDNAWKSVQDLGYVNNQASIVLGVPVGTPSYTAKAAADKRKQDLADAKQKLKDEKEKAAQTLANQKALIDYRDAKSGSSGTDGGNTSSMKDIKTYNQLITAGSDDSGEDLYNAITSGATSLKPGTSDYNRAVSFAQKKYYSQVLANYNKGAYKDLSIILSKGITDYPDYYKKVLGPYYNTLMNKVLADKKKKSNNSGPFTTK